MQYGENIHALSVALNTVGAMSVKRIHEILSGVFNIPIATGTISNMVKRCADGLGNTVDKIRQRIQGPLHAGILMRLELEWIKSSGGYIMPQIVNTLIWISVPKGDLRTWSSARPY